MPDLFPSFEAVAALIAIVTIGGVWDFLTAFRRWSIAERARDDFAASVEAAEVATKVGVELLTGPAEPPNTRGRLVPANEDKAVI